MIADTGQGDDDDLMEKIRQVAGALISSSIKAGVTATQMQQFCFDFRAYLASNYNPNLSHDPANAAIGAAIAKFDSLFSKLDVDLTERFGFDGLAAELVELEIDPADLEMDLSEFGIDLAVLGLDLSDFGIDIEPEEEE